MIGLEVIHGDRMTTKKTETRTTRKKKIDGKNQGLRRNIGKMDGKKPHHRQKTVDRSEPLR
tara:strand:- start:547 stop:729 length:183 start_codon:yes stop_codon:yes gene_type:complete